MLNRLCTSVFLFLVFISPANTFAGTMLPSNAPTVMVLGYNIGWANACSKKFAGKYHKKFKSIIKFLKKSSSKQDNDLIIEGFEIWGGYLNTAKCKKNV